MSALSIKEDKNLNMVLPERTQCPDILYQHLLFCENYEQYFTPLIYRKIKELNEEQSYYKESCISYIKKEGVTNSNLFPTSTLNGVDIKKNMRHYFTDNEISEIKSICSSLEGKYIPSLEDKSYEVIVGVAHLIWFASIEHFWYIHKKTKFNQGYLDTSELDSSMCEKMDLKVCGECQLEEDYDWSRNEFYEEDKEKFDTPGLYYPNLIIDNSKLIKHSLGFNKFPMSYEQIQIDMMAPPEYNKYGINILISIPKIKFGEEFYYNERLENEKPFMDSFKRYLDYKNSI